MLKRTPHWIVQPCDGCGYWSRSITTAGSKRRHQTTCNVIRIHAYIFQQFGWQTNVAGSRTSTTSFVGGKNTVTTTNYRCSISFCTYTIKVQYTNHRDSQICSALAYGMAWTRHVLHHKAAGATAGLLLCRCSGWAHTVTRAQVPWCHSGLSS